MLLLSVLMPLLNTMHNLVPYLVDHPERGNGTRGRRLRSHSNFPPTLFFTTSTVTVSSTLPSVPFYGWSNWLTMALYLTLQFIPMLRSLAQASHRFAFRRFALLLFCYFRVFLSTYRSNFNSKSTRSLIKCLITELRDSEMTVRLSERKSLLDFS